MKTCYLIHGIKTRDSGQSTIVFLKHILPLNVEVLSYGYIPVLAAPFASIINAFVIRRFVKELKPGQILIGHSNGCTIAHGVSSKLYACGLVLINPALDADIEFDPSLRFIHVYWSPKDRITWLSKFVPFSRWGSMGTTGYKGDDPRVKQWDMNIRHTDIGDAEAAVQWGPLIVRNIMDELKKVVRPVSN